MFRNCVIFMTEMSCGRKVACVLLKLTFTVFPKYARSVVWHDDADFNVQLNLHYNNSKLWLVSMQPGLLQGGLQGRFASNVCLRRLGASYLNKSYHVNIFARTICWRLFNLPDFFTICIYRGYPQSVALSYNS